MGRTVKTIVGIVVIVALWALVGVGAAFVALAMGARPGTAQEPGWEGVAIAVLYLLSGPLAIVFFIKRASRRAAEEFDQATRDRIGVLKVTVRGDRKH